jgi:ribosomal protein S18 acetylase RimI-like enzyme
MPETSREASSRFGVARATAADVEVLLGLMHDFYAEAGFALDRPRTAAALRSLLSSASLGSVWLARSDDGGGGGGALGHAVLTVRFTMEHEGLSGYIDDLYVVPQARRAGVGHALLTELVAECRARGCKALKVEVGQSNAAALGLYAKFGLQAAADGRILASGALREAGT